MSPPPPFPHKKFILVKLAVSFVPVSPVAYIPVAFCRVSLRKFLDSFLLPPLKLKLDGGDAKHDRDPPKHAPKWLMLIQVAVQSTPKDSSKSMGCQSQSLFTVNLTPKDNVGKSFCPEEAGSHYGTGSCRLQRCRSWSRPLVGGIGSSSKESCYCTYSNAVGNVVNLVHEKDGRHNVRSMPPIA